MDIFKNVQFLKPPDISGKDQNGKTSLLHNGNKCVFSRIFLLHNIFCQNRTLLLFVLTIERKEALKNSEKNINGFVWSNNEKPLGRFKVVYPIEHKFFSVLKHRTITVAYLVRKKYMDFGRLARRVFGSCLLFFLKIKSENFSKLDIFKNVHLSKPPDISGKDQNRKTRLLHNGNKCVFSRIFSLHNIFCQNRTLLLFVL